MGSSRKHCARRRGRRAPVGFANAPVPVGLYAYDPRRYLFDVKITGIVSVLAMGAGALMIASGFLAPIGLLAMVVGAYSSFNTYIAHAYPEKVRITEDGISFSSFGRTDSYRLSDVTGLSVRENPRTLSAYVRVNGGGIVRGRYFVGAGNMVDERGERAEGLYRYLLLEEAELDPDNIRVRARRSSGVYESLAPTATGPQDSGAVDGKRGPR